MAQNACSAMNIVTVLSNVPTVLRSYRAFRIFGLSTSIVFLSSILNASFFLTQLSSNCIRFQSVDSYFSNVYFNMLVIPAIGNKLHFRPSFCFIADLHCFS